MTAPATTKAGRGGDAALVLAFITRNLRSVAIVALAAAVASSVVALLLPKRYVSSASFVADQGSQLQLSSSLLGLAGALGSSLPGASSSPQFYAAVASSERVFLSVIYHQGYELRDGTTGNLAQAMETARPDSARQELVTLKMLRRQVAISAEPRTGIVRIDVTARSPELAAAIAGRFLATIDSFNVYVRQSRAAAEEEFVERRLDSAASDLRSAESELMGFRRQNRIVETSPELLLQQQRLQRAVELRQSLYVTLSQQFEQARIAAKRDVPAITVIEQPRPPLQRDSPRRKVIVLGAVAMAVGVWTLALVGLALWSDAYPPERWPAALRSLIRA